MAAPTTTAFRELVRTAPAVPQQASAGRTEERDRRSRLNDQAARNQAAQAAGFRADDRKIDPALLSSVSGRIQVKIWLTDASPEALAKLKDAGFTAKAPVAGRFVTGEIDAARLGDLARLSFVRRIKCPADSCGQRTRQVPLMKSLDGDCRRRSLSRGTWRACGGECRVEEPGGKL